MNVSRTMSTQATQRADLVSQCLPSIRLCGVGQSAHPKGLTFIEMGYVGIKGFLCINSNLPSRIQAMGNMLGRHQRTIAGNAPLWGILEEVPF